MTGALRGRDRVEIGSTGEVRGDISTQRIAIGEGAQMHSKVEITRADGSQPAKSGSKANAGSTSNATAMAMNAGAEHGN